MMSLRDLRKLDRDDVLDLVGLRRSDSNEWVVPALTALGVGLLVGAGLACSWPPRPVPSCVTTCVTGSAPPRTRFRSGSAPWRPMPRRPTARPEPENSPRRFTARRPPASPWDSPGG
jgi:hypothetical protein